jgi:hypothetical protein
MIRHIALAPLAVLALLILLSPMAFAAPGQYQKAAEEALQHYKGFVDPERFNFTNRAELEGATLGEAVPIYVFSVVELAEGVTALENAMGDAGEVEYIVYSGGRAVTRLTMVRDGEQLVAKRFGGLGSALAEALLQLPEEARSDARMVYLNALPFVYGKVNANEFLINLQEYAIGDLEPHRLYTGREAVSRMQEIAQGMIARAAENPEALDGVAASTQAPLTQSRARFMLLWSGLAAGVLFATGALLLRRRRAA